MTNCTADKTCAPSPTILPQNDFVLAVVFSSRPEALRGCPTHCTAVTEAERLDVGYFGSAYDAAIRRVWVHLTRQRDKQHLAGGKSHTSTLVNEVCADLDQLILDIELPSRETRQRRGRHITCLSPARSGSFKRAPSRWRWKGSGRRHRQDPGGECSPVNSLDVCS